MTRVPGTPVDSTSLNRTPSEYSTVADNATSESGVVAEYHGTRYFYAQTNANLNDRASLQARQLAKLAARLAALKRRIAARRQRRGLHGWGGEEDSDGDLMDGVHHGPRRAEAGGGSGGRDGGSGGQSDNHEHGGSWSGDSGRKLDIKVQNTRPVREPAPGALAVCIAAEGSDGIKQEQLAENWCAALASIPNKLASDPRRKTGPEFLAAQIDLHRTKLQLGSLKKQGMGTWIGKLRELVTATPVKAPAADAAQGKSGTAATPDIRRELTALQTCYALLPILALKYDAECVPTRETHAMNTATTQHNALQARPDKP
jgi:hypothetical protein